jgi:putative ABC transport system ATP-binding protein
MPVLEAKDLVKRYTAPDGSTTTVLDVPHFALEAGEHAALRGESGAGKTTLLHCLAGILTPDGGHVVVDGEAISSGLESQRDSIRARKIGYVFQTFNLLQGLTALENVELGMMFSGKHDAGRARHLLERVGLADRIHYRPSQLSVGQQQRVAVARALANAPAVVLADEPTGNLDLRRASEALELMREICRESNAALLVVSHSTETLAAFDRVQSLTELNRAAQLGDAHDPAAAQR